MRYYKRRINETEWRETSRFIAESIVGAEDYWGGAYYSKEMLDIPNHIICSEWEILVIGWDGSMPPEGYTNLMPRAYLEITGKDGRDPWVDPGKVFLGGLTQIVQDAREEEVIRKQKEKERKEEKDRKKLMDWLDTHWF